MSINLLQIDSSGEERITALFQNDEERQTYYYLAAMETCAPGCTIFTHRLSDDGFHLCTVPSAFWNLVGLGYYPPRLCGCFTCIDQRDFLREYCAWTIASEIRNFDESTLEERDDVLSR